MIYGRKATQHGGELDRNPFLTQHSTGTFCQHRAWPGVQAYFFSCRAKLGTQ